MMERDYAAPPARVFAAWTEVDVLRRWFGCATDTLWNVHLWEVRVGGRIHVSLDFGGRPFEVKGEFLVVEPPRRLQYRWSENETVEVLIEPRGGGSRLRLTHTFPADAEGRSLRSHGWSNALDLLGRAQPGTGAR